jgi:hypothetical protein
MEKIHPPVRDQKESESKKTSSNSFHTEQIKNSMTEFDNDWGYQGKRKDQPESGSLAYIIIGVAAILTAFIIIIKKIYF